MERLLQYFGQIGFQGNDLDKVVGAFEFQRFSKNDLVVTEGKVSRHIGFVESGMFQYFVNKDGNEITHYVNVPNTWFASVMSFVGEKPSLENVRALTDGAIFMINKPNLRKLVDELPAFKDFYVALLEHSIVGIDESRHDLIVLTADQRYAKLLRKEPHLLQMIPLQHLASILGVTPRHLSRIRAAI